MQVLITHGSVARTRVLHLGRWQLAGLAAAAVLLMLALSGTVYHLVFLKAARDGWPVVSALVRLVVSDEIAERERFMRDNLAAMAQRVGEFEARLVQLQAMGERVAGLAGVGEQDLGGVTPPAPLPSTAPPGAAARGTDRLADRPASGPSVPPTPPAPSARPGSGGPFLPWRVPAAGARLEDPAAATLAALRGRLDGLDAAAAWQGDLLTLSESRLQERRLLAMMVPTAAPVDGPLGSGFGFREDPFTGRPALHTGLDFPADVGTPIRAAAAGIVVAREEHPAYGLMLEIDHGNGLATRYAHCEAIDVPLGALVRRGQPVARVGNTGRSTGPHLHFEVLLDGVPQNPARFLAAGQGGRPLAAGPFAQPPRRR
jgi:murein DD-endopeptidase MepM/ murein hydrolase activator NlpD